MPAPGQAKKMDFTHLNKQTNIFFHQGFISFFHDISEQKSKIWLTNWWTNDGYKGVLLHPIPLLEIFLFFEIWHFLIKSSDFGDWAHQGGFLC